MKLIHLTDLHLGPVGEELWGLDPYARADAMLSDIADRHADAALCVITGDLADKGDPCAYAWLRDRLAAFPLEGHAVLTSPESIENLRAVTFDGTVTTP